MFFFFLLFTFQVHPRKNVELDLIIECLLGFTKFSFSRIHFTLNYSNKCNFKSLQSLSPPLPHNLSLADSRLNYSSCHIFLMHCAYSFSHPLTYLFTNRFSNSSSYRFTDLLSRSVSQSTMHSLTY